MSFERLVRAHKDDMTTVGNLVGLDEQPIHEGATVIFVPGEPSCDFVHVTWTAEDDYLTLTPDPDAVDGYVRLFRAKLTELRRDIDRRPRWWRAKKQESAAALHRVLSAFEAAQGRDTS